MSTQDAEPTYPKTYRGNQIHGEKRVRELPDRLQLVTAPTEMDRNLDHIGVDHNRESIVLEDSYNCLWVDTENGEYSEVWGIHKSTPQLDCWAVKLK